jgi:DNA-directed RNA polymerase specialized sigma24 family protein
VKNSSTPKVQRKKDWALSPDAFRQLLAWLDEGRDSGGERYLEMRRRLISYFDRKNCVPLDDLADETLNRAARRLEEEGAITDTTPAQYCYIIAKFVFLEHLREAEHRNVGLDEVPIAKQAAPDPATVSWQVEEAAKKEQQQDCFEHCLAKLEPDNRQLIVQYYHGEQRTKIENRRMLAERLHITMNALSIRAYRLRDRLENCVRTCLQRGE